MGILGQFRCFIPWMANSLAGLSLLWGFLRPPSGKEAMVLSIAAIPLALVTLTIRSVLRDEAGNTVDVVVGPAFYVWLASLVTLAAGQAVRCAAMAAA